VKASGKPSDIVERLNEIAGFPSDEDIELYEVRNIYNLYNLESI
jgi:ubiquitin carboxyl-terminal hydrolase 7